MIGISGYDHVGIRIVERGPALAFYGSLGFYPEAPKAAYTERAVNLVNRSGVRINLICNGVRPPGRRNVLLDVPDKWPGVTHPAFVVDSLHDVLIWAERYRIAITEGPVEWEGRRRVCFVRDPDGNVLEFDEIMVSSPITGASE